MYSGISCFVIHDFVLRVMLDTIFGLFIFLLYFYLSFFVIQQHLFFLELKTTGSFVCFLFFSPFPRSSSELSVITMSTNFLSPPSKYNTKIWFVIAFITTFDVLHFFLLTLSPLGFEVPFLQVLVMATAPRDSCTISISKSCLFDYASFLSQFAFCVSLFPFSCSSSTSPSFSFSVSSHLLWLEDTLNKLLLHVPKLDSLFFYSSKTLGRSEFLSHSPYGNSCSSNSS